MGFERENKIKYFTQTLRPSTFSPLKNACTGKGFQVSKGKKGIPVL
jgi:hypothetical protein